MFVRDRMTSPAVTITEDTPFQEALRIMREHRFHRLPVVDKKGKLIGNVSERDLLHASPSPASSLSVWEMNYLLWKLTVEELMTKDVITISPDEPIEVAAAIMVDRGIGGMPVVDKERRVVGVITETDIFKAFVEMMGSDHPGLRLMLAVPDRKGALAQLAATIADLDGNIVSVGTFVPDNATHADLVVKVDGVSQEQLVTALESLGDHVVDVREM